MVETIAIQGHLDSHALEALQLELRALADSCGLTIQRIGIKTMKTG